MKNFSFLIAGAAAFLFSALAAQAATTTSATVGTSSSTVLSNASGVLRSYVAIDNESTTATIACLHGAGTPAINTAGSVTIPPGVTAVWGNGGNWNTSDAFSCISSGASTPVTIESQP